MMSLSRWPLLEKDALAMIGGLGPEVADGYRGKEGVDLC
jgi:hypothetical protein